MKPLFFFLLIITFACTKEVARNWEYTQLMEVFRSKCGPDSITLIHNVKAKTDDEMIVIRQEMTFERWMKPDELMFITVKINGFIVPLYQIYKLPDSVWVKSSILKWGVSKCMETVEIN